MGEPKLLSELNVKQLSRVAKDHYLLVCPSSWRKEHYLDAIHTAMLEETVCPMCEGQQCAPASHYFPVHVYDPGEGTSVPPAHGVGAALAGANNSDEPVLPVSEPFVALTTPSCAATTAATHTNASAAILAGASLQQQLQFQQQLGRDLAQPQQ